VEAAPRHVQGEHAGPDRSAPGLAGESGLDRVDALVEGQERRHVAAGQEQGHRGSTFRIVA
jgi:hypothetical protein